MQKCKNAKSLVEIEGTAPPEDDVSHPRERESSGKVDDGHVSSIIDFDQQKRCRKNNRKYKRFVLIE